MNSLNISKACPYMISDTLFHSGKSFFHLIFGTQLINSHDIQDNGQILAAVFRIDIALLFVDNVTPIHDVCTVFSKQLDPHCI